MGEESKTLGGTVFQLLQKSNENLIFVENIETHEYEWSNNSIEELGLKSVRFSEVDLWEKIIHPDDYEAFQKARTVMVNGVSNQMRGEYVIRKKDGYYTRMFFHGFFFIQKSSHEKIFAGIFSDPYQYHAFNTFVGVQGQQEFFQALDTITNHLEEWMIMEIAVQELDKIIDIYSEETGMLIFGHLKKSIEKCLDTNMFCYQLEERNFGVLFQGRHTEQVERFFRKLQSYLMEPVAVGKYFVTYSVSAGVLRYPEDGKEREELIRNVRITLRKALEDKKHPFLFFSQELIYREQKKMQMLEKLQLSILDGYHGFYLCYQPLIKAEDGRIFGAEALLRWCPPDSGEIVYPDQFIPLLEESGMILSVGKWVLRTAIEQCEKWEQLCPGFVMNINVASQQFEEPDFAFEVMNIVKQYNIEPRQITLELTESEELKAPKEMRGVFEFLRGQGLKIAFDDFGTGYGSLSIFRILSGDELKIDKEFLENITYDTSVQKIVGMVIDLCHKLNMIVCVEGVEREAEELIVKQLGGDILQGYYYDRPILPEQFEEKYFSNQTYRKEKRAKAKDLQSVMGEISDYNPIHYMDSESIMNHAFASIFQLKLDDQLTFINCNEEMRKRLGHTAKVLEEEYGNRGLSFLDEEDVPRVMSDIYTQLSKSDEAITEYRVVGASGERRWVLASARAVRDKSGQPTLVVVSIDNDSMKKKALDTERKYHLLRRMTDVLPGGVICIKNDPNFSIEFLSEGFLELSGYKKDDIIEGYQGKFLGIIYREDRNKFIGTVYKNGHRGSAFSIAFRIVCKSGNLMRVKLLGKSVEGDKDHIQRLCATVIEYEAEPETVETDGMLGLECEPHMDDSQRLVLEKDGLTGLWGKESVTALLKEIIQSDSKTKWILCIINIDDFRTFNKEHGHPNGDKLICAVAERLDNMFLQSKAAGRIGIDEFACWMEYDGELPTAFYCVQQLSDEISKPYVIHGVKKPVTITWSIGVAFYPEDGKTCNTLWSRANKALYVAKELGGNSFSFASAMED